MMQFLAFVPYAAAAYCVAHMARDVWPSISSQMSTATHASSRHGMDGEDPRAYMRAQDPCYNPATRQIEGGQFDGRILQPGDVTMYDAGTTVRANVGGLMLELPVRNDPSSSYYHMQSPSVPPDAGPWCGDQTRRQAVPAFRQGTCRNPGRLARKKRRWSGRRRR